MSDERLLVVRAARGDRDAFDALIGPRWERMVRIAARVVGEPEEARDVAQSACLRLWQSLDRFRPEEDLDGWIYRVVVNLAIDALRRRRVRPEEPWPVSRALERPYEPPDLGPSPEGRAFARELERALHELTERLPPRQKAVFVLARVEGMTAPEVGRIMGVTASTVRNHLAQLRAELARGLRERYPELAGLPAEPSRGGGTDPESEG